MSLMMKKLAVIVMGAALFGCASSDNVLSDVGQGIFKQAVDYKCRSEINANSLYKTVSIIMSDAQKTALEDKVCGCVSEKAPQSVTAGELGQAIIDPSARTQIVGKVVAKSLSACVNDFVTGS